MCQFGQPFTTCFGVTTDCRHLQAAGRVSASEWKGVIEQSSKLATLKHGRAEVDTQVDSASGSGLVSASGIRSVVLTERQLIWSGPKLRRP